MRRVTLDPEGKYEGPIVADHDRSLLKSGKARPRFVLAPLSTGRYWRVSVPSPQMVPDPALLIR